jgi:hypothetical protein
MEFALHGQCDAFGFLHTRLLLVLCVRSTTFCECFIFESMAEPYDPFTNIMFIRFVFCYCSAK